MLAESFRGGLPAAAGRRPVSPSWLHDLLVIGLLRSPDGRDCCWRPRLPARPSWTVRLWRDHKTLAKSDRFLASSACRDTVRYFYAVFSNILEMFLVPSMELKESHNSDRSMQGTKFPPRC